MNARRPAPFQQFYPPAVLRWWMGLLLSGCAACGTTSGDGATADSQADTLVADAPAPLADSAGPLPDGDAMAGDSADAAKDASPAAPDTQQADSAVTPAPTTGICFGELPSPSTATGSVPMPTAACPELDTPEWYLDGPLPPPSLTLQLGRRTAAGQWLPIADGDWIGLETAMQGGFHLDLAPKVLLPGQKEPKIQLQAEAFAAAECNPVASLNLAKGWLVKEAGPEPWYSFEATAKPLVIFGVSVSKKAQFCGLWLRVHWRLRLPGSNQWGEVVRILRTYDATQLP